MSGLVILQTFPDMIDGDATILDLDCAYAYRRSRRETQIYHLLECAMLRGWVTT